MNSYPIAKGSEPSQAFRAKMLLKKLLYCQEEFLSVSRKISRRMENMRIQADLENHMQVLCLDSPAALLDVLYF